MVNVKDFTITIDEKDIDLYLARPTHEEVLAIDMEYRKIYSMAIREGVITQAEAIKQFKQVGAWDSDDEEEISRIMFEISLLERVIRNESESATEDERREAALKATKLRSDLLRKMGTRTSLFEQTAEQMAEEQKIHKYILLCCRRKDDEERFFDSREEQQQFANNEAEEMSTIYREAYFFDYNLPEDISQDWEEVKYLKKMAEEQLEKNTKSEEKQPKKRGRPKKSKVS